jgi:hypothetical protein
MDSVIIQKIQAQGMDPNTVKVQLDNFKEGFPFLHLVGPARPDQGIRVYTDTQVEEYADLFRTKAPHLDLVKFVPASGAASRMFKDLFSFLEGNGNLEESPFAKKFIQHLRTFALVDDLEQHLLQRGESLQQLLDQQAYQKIIHTVLSDEGLGYGNLPKGLLKFHAYKTGNRTPAQEHLIEGQLYGVGKNKQVNLHFTVSPEHESRFVAELSALLPSFQSQTGLQVNISYSHQKKTTDTIAVDEANEPFLEADGSLLFRPAGHGALIENLNDIQADILFIKNIDNVVPDRLKATTQTYKMALAGVLLEVQARVFEALAALEKEVTTDSVALATRVYTQEFGGLLPDAVSAAGLADQANFLQAKLNRPIRVCGMVRNTGEPGGGPFWVVEKDGSQSLQILETAQINAADPKSIAHLQASTHFNPVDLVCATRDYKGNSFNLLDFRDPATGFITEKSKNGKVLKALELPGLWNGAMAYWNSLFVEVPLITFNPVKTINDLLREEHQEELK